MPLTAFQAGVARLLSKNKSPDSYLAGGAALHLEPHTIRFSEDLDYFSDSTERVAKAFDADQDLLKQNGYEVTVHMSQPGFVRAVITKNKTATKVEWAHDSAWRFLPTIYREEVGYQLHPMDLAINKVLTLAGRDEPRDFLDIMHIQETILPLGALCWAAAGKDPGFTPFSLLEMLKRRGRFQPEEFDRLYLAKPVEPIILKQTWLTQLETADSFIKSRPPTEIGCLYYDTKQQRFVEPDAYPHPHVVCHFGRPGGVLPRLLESE